jgi:hypothetical protein
MHVCVCLWVNACMCVLWMNAYMYVSVDECMYVCLWMKHVCVYRCEHACLQVHIHGDNRLVCTTSL